MLKNHKIMKFGKKKIGNYTANTVAAKGQIT